MPSDCGFRPLIQEQLISYVNFLGILSATKSDPDELLHAKTMELLENSKDLSYGEALDIVAKNNMDLTERYLLGG